MRREEKEKYIDREKKKKIGKEEKATEVIK